MISSAMGIWNYWIVFILMMIGLFLVIGRKNFLKKIVGLTIFQTSVFLLYITFGKITGATPPILNETLDTVYSNPLPHVLILTAIVVGVATTALGLSLVLRINSDSTDLKIEPLILKIFTKSKSASLCFGYKIEASSKDVNAFSISPF